MDWSVARSGMAALIAMGQVMKAELVGTFVAMLLLPKSTVGATHGPAASGRAV